MWRGADFMEDRTGRLACNDALVSIHDSTIVAVVTHSFLY